LHLNTECAQTDGRKKESYDISPVHSVDLADIITAIVNIIFRPGPVLPSVSHLELTPVMRKNDVIHKTRSTRCLTTLPEMDGATAIGNMHR